MSSFQTSFSNSIRDTRLALFHVTSVFAQQVRCFSKLEPPTKQTISQHVSSSRKTYAEMWGVEDVSLITFYCDTPYHDLIPKTSNSQDNSNRNNMKQAGKAYSHCNCTNNLTFILGDAHSTTCKERINAQSAAFTSINTFIVVSTKYE